MPGWPRPVSQGSPVHPVQEQCHRRQANAGRGLRERHVLVQVASKLEVQTQTCRCYREQMPLCVACNEVRLKLRLPG